MDVPAKVKRDRISSSSMFLYYSGPQRIGRCLSTLMRVDRLYSICSFQMLNSSIKTLMDTPRIIFHQVPRNPLAKVTHTINHHNNSFWQLSCQLMTDLEPELSSYARPRFLTHRNRDNKCLLFLTARCCLICCTTIDNTEVESMGLIERFGARTCERKGWMKEDIQILDLRKWMVVSGAIYWNVESSEDITHWGGGIKSSSLDTFWRDY